LSVFGESPNGFPKLPIIDSRIPARSERQKYGWLFYLAIAGLVILTALVAWFAHAAWGLRDVGALVYVLHDPQRSESERIQAAFRLSRDSRLNDSQLMEMSLRRDLPSLARYLMAEAVSTDLVAYDPRSYALTVARSTGWPDWLRLVLARRLAYGAARSYAIPRVALDELANHADPMIGLWAISASALLPGSEPSWAARLEQAARVPGEPAALASMLLAALAAPPAQRETLLDEATIWLRDHHAQAAKLWQGWQIRDGQLIRDGTS
jgi:hypothetical protein